MGWSIGFDDNWNRDIGYGVPAMCDQPECKHKIDRGLAYVCGSDPKGGAYGCGLYFCAEHLDFKELDNKRTIQVPGEERIIVQLCERCMNGKEPFEAKPDIPRWNAWKLKDASWKQWRDENPDKVEKIKQALGKKK